MGGDFEPEGWSAYDDMGGNVKGMQVVAASFWRCS